MEPSDLATQLDFLDFPASELAILVEVSDAQVARWLSGEDPIPAWLDLLTLYWCKYEGALQHARRRAVAVKRDGPTLDDIFAGDQAKIVRDVTH